MQLSKRESTPSPADGWDDTAAEAEARLIRGSLLKFADWKWSSGKEMEAVEVKEGRRLAAVATAAAWVKWQGGKPVGRQGNVVPLAISEYTQVD